MNRRLWWAICYAFSKLYKADAGGTVKIGILMLYQSFKYVIFAYITKLLVNSLAEQKNMKEIIALVIFEFSLICMDAFIENRTKISRTLLISRSQVYVQSELLSKISKLNLIFFESSQNSDKLQRLKMDLSFRPNLMTESVLMLFTGLISGILSAVIIFHYNPYLILVMLLIFLGFAFSYKNVARSIMEEVEFLTPDQRRIHYMTDLILNLQYIKDTKINRLQENLINNITVLGESINNHRYNIEKLKSKNIFFYEIMLNIPQYISIVVIVLMVFDGKYTVSDFLFVSANIVMFRRCIESGLQSTNSLIEHSVFLQDLTELEDVIVKQGQNVGVVLEQVQNISVQNVGFGYTENQILQNVTFEASTGEVVAIVGKNGSGKSTLVKLLLGFYQSQQGTILINGVDNKNIELNSLYHQAGVLLQDYTRYPFSLLENVTLWREGEVDWPRLEQVLETVNLNTFVESLPTKHETQLSRIFELDGIDLSGGQWQKVAIARTLYKAASFYILDEAGASLDPESEMKIFESFLQRKHNAIVLYITHRLNLASRADRILVLDHGRIVEQGTHRELMENKALYWEMFTTQATSYHQAERDNDHQEFLRPSLPF